MTHSVMRFRFNAIIRYWVVPFGRGAWIFVQGTSVVFLTSLISLHSSLPARKPITVNSVITLHYTSPTVAPPLPILFGDHQIVLSYSR